MNIYEIPIVKITDETPDTYTIQLKNIYPDIFTYSPGQYLTVIANIDGKEERRAYSLSSSPYIQDHLAITIKRISGGKVSNYLRDTFKEGMKLKVLPPQGNFCLTLEPIQCKHYIFIGAGSGITPLMSMLSSVLAIEPLSKVSLFYGCRNEDAIIFQHQLSELGKRHSGRFNVYISLSQPSPMWNGNKGRIDREKIYDLMLDLFLVDENQKLYFICGPEEMMIAVEEGLQKHAIHSGFIYKEYFNTTLVPKNPNTHLSAALLNEISSSQQAPDILEREIIFLHKDKAHLINVSPDESILAAILTYGLDISYSCMNGICSSCKLMLEDGEVFQKVSLGLSEKENVAGYILSCQAHPLDNNVIVKSEE